MSKNFQFWLIYALAWVPYALGYATVFAVQSRVGFAPAALNSAHNILPAAFLGIGAVWICRRFSPQRRHPFIFGICQVAFACVYAILWNLLAPLSFSLRRLLEGRDWFFSLFEGYALQWQIFAGLMIYATIASIVYTLEFSQKAREEQARAMRAEHLRTEAELNALRAQLNPHFLFNTLHSLMALVRTDSDDAEKAIERLADLLRYSLKAKHNGMNDDVTLSAEWKFVQNYLALESLRLGARLKVETDLPPDTFDHLLPAFTLQPLIENAIKHAVAPNPHGAKVSVVARSENDCLRLEVKDDGAGVLPEKVFANGGTGLRVVTQRLETRYRGGSQFQIQTAPGSGFHVILLIPQEEMLKDAEDK